MCRFVRLYDGKAKNRIIGYAKEDGYTCNQNYYSHQIVGSSN
jgi:hypothetical protein